MKLVNQYIIPFTGLANGDHTFTFDFRKEFFDLHEVLEIRDGRVDAEVVLNKKPTLLSLSISLGGYLELHCDRCLDYFQMPISYSGNLIIKFGEDTSSGTDEIWILHPNENILDLAQYFYECIGLCIPIQRIHPDSETGSSGCNPTMIEFLDTHSKAVKKQDESDPRWNKLKDLLNDNNTN